MSFRHQRMHHRKPRKRMMIIIARGMMIIM